MFNTLPANPFPPSSEQMGAGGGGSYVLPVASADTLGGVKVGNNLSIDNGVLSAPAPYTPLNYSTTEQNTGIKWVDNKDIFVKTVDVGTLPNNTSKNVSLGVENVNIIDFRGVANTVANDYNIVLPSCTTNNRNLQVNINGATGIINISSADNYTDYTKAYITVYYTKTESEG